MKITCSVSRHISILPQKCATATSNWPHTVRTSSLNQNKSSTHDRTIQMKIKGFSGMRLNRCVPSFRCFKVERASKDELKRVDAMYSAIC